MDLEPIAVSFVLESNDALVHGEVFVGAEPDYGELTWCIEREEGLTQWGH